MQGYQLNVPDQEEKTGAVPAPILVACVSGHITLREN